MRSLARTVRRHPIAVFIVLAYALSWTLVPFGGLLGSGPFFAALFVLWVLQGRPGVVALIRRMLQWRIGWRWYAAALLLPAGAAVLAGLITVALGAERPSDADLATWTAIPLNFVVFLLLPLLGPWEEPGFRGFALSQLREDRSPLTAALLVGVIHVGFHGPLILMGDIPLSDVVFIMAASVVFAWLVIGSGGSVLIAMMMHAANNVVSGEYVTLLFSGDDAEVLGWTRAALWCVVALIVVALTRMRLGAPEEGQGPAPADRGGDPGPGEESR